MAPIFAVLLIVVITIIAMATLYAFRPPLPNAPLTLSYFVGTAGTEPTWGDGTDCKVVGGVETCQILPAINIIFPNPPQVFVSDLTLVFFCNQSVYLDATFQDMEFVPGSTVAVSGGPQLQHCGTYTPPRASWNRFAFFDQVVPGSVFLRPGDTLVFYAHTFTNFTDEDFHGAPEWCYSVPNACSIDIFYTGTPTSLAASIPLEGLGGV